MSSRPHPAVGIAAWCVFALLLQRLAPLPLTLLALPTLALVAAHAWRESLRLLRRARWLLLAIAALFVVATPGERVPGAAGELGISIDGLRLAGEHLLRLVLLLATLASMLRLLGRDGLICGLHTLLRPIGRRRERLVVRLMLALEYSETAPAASWRDWLGDGGGDAPQHVRLALRPLEVRDRVVLALLLGSVIAILAS